jgi:hypothetical protein
MTIDGLYDPCYPAGTQTPGDRRERIMVGRLPNDRLAALLAETSWSNAGLARRVNDECRSRGVSRSYTPTSVANWLNGMVPAVPVPEVLAHLFAQRLGRPVTLADLGYAEDVPLDLGLAWEPTARATVGTVAKLWRVDMERRALLLGSAWLSTAFATPTREWLLDWATDDTSHTGGRRIGAPEVEVVWGMCHAFADADHRLGGGYARTTLIHYVNDVVLPMLDGTYSEQVGRLLLAATARLCDLAGFMAFDSGPGHQGLAQRYYIQALRLAQASRDRALGAHVLADMAMQAHYVGNAPEAVSLARAGQRAALESGSYSSVARCSAMEARAHALAQDPGSCAQAMTRAEHALDRVQPDEEPFWIRFFTPEQLQAEFTYAAADLGHADEVETFARPVLDAAGEMERRRVLVTATLASSYLPAPGACDGDVDQACATLSETLPLVQTLTTKRGVEAVNQVRRQLAPYRDRAPVRELEAAFQPLIGAAV